MNSSQPDKLHYIKIPGGHGARAEQVRMVYALSGKPYVDVLHSFADVQNAVAGKTPFNQLPFVETPAGEIIYQTLAIMYHAGRGTPVWPEDPATLMRALEVGIAGYDFYQWFGGFPADDLAAKKKFEERRVPQFINGFGKVFEARPFAAGDAPTFADCLVHEAVAWVVRRNEVCRKLYEATPSLVAFRARFEAIPAIRDFMARQAAARKQDDSV
jgi:glutathione S-transferase